MKDVILAGGIGTRISEESHLKPKPMIEVGGRPILWHIMKTYSHYGFNDFIVCLGYKEMTQPKLNDAFDVYSNKPASKFEIVEPFALHHGLKYSVRDSCPHLTVTGFKDHYYSTNYNATSIGYAPIYSSIEGIENEVNNLLKKIVIKRMKI